ncbi:uncharacterized protein LOC119355935 isoform X4 [Triticum dicoccoides]|uniref:uncharacterized protein LOC119355935 isoform X4 n=1 Tax=Triticum dicoccoides TaxID=85692 RepID=UPI001890AB12|nr:uncharacterized protein LOC119355935 isoform X4 [Triticum dicoccoides]
MFQLPIEMVKQVYECNWVPSRVTKDQLNRCVATVSLAKKEVIHWRAPSTENPPEPKDGEVIIFVDHLGRGFSPSGSKFFRDVLASFQLHPQDIGPNSVSNICHFQVFCEAYLQEEPTVELFRDFFHLNHRTEFTDGPNTELGGMAVQKRKEVSFPHAKLQSHPKEWNQTWFYCKDTSPTDENPLPGCHPHCLSNTHPFPQRLTAKERATYAPQLSKLRAFMANGLAGVDFSRCWLSWSILPLSRHPGLMCEYTGSLKDPQRHMDIQLTDDEVTEAVKKMLNEPEAICSQTGLSPFCTSNKPPAGDDPFWKKKPQDKPAKPQDKAAKPLRPKTKVVKKPAKKRTTVSFEPNADADVANPDLEDDAESSQADDVETQQHEARRTTRHNGQVVTSAGLPNTLVRKRRSEVSYTLDTSCPKAGCFRQPLNPSDSNYQGTSHSSSGESSATKLPPLKTVPGAKPRPRKKARLTKPADDNVVVEPEKTLDPEETNADAMLNDPPPQGHDFFAEQV